MVFHKYKLIVVGIPKNASQSLYSILRNQSDLENDHFTYNEILNNHDKELLDTYQSLAIVRNPYDRAVSSYGRFLRFTSYPLKYPYIKNFEQYLTTIYYQNIKELNEEPWWIPQWEFVTNGKKILVDTVLRFENLNLEWENFVKNYNSKRSNKFKISSDLKIINKNDEKDENYITYYNSKCIDLVNKLYKKDFELFNYEML
jgi:hypothetical protein